jgi:sugar lactone lactonase YvrE
MSRGKWTGGGVGVRIALFTLAVASAWSVFVASAFGFGMQSYVPAGFSPITGAGTGVTIHAPSGIAVDGTSGNVFLNDGAVEEVTDIFGAKGEVPTGVASPYRINGFVFNGEPSGAAVDNSVTSAAKGTLYVVDVGDSQVKKFVRNSGTELYEAAGELVPTDGPGFSEPLGDAVDSHGNVFVADYGSESVIEFSPTGVQLARIGTAETVGNPSSVAVDGAGDLFVQGYPEGSAVYKYPANGSGEVEEEVFNEVVESGATGVAVDASANALYIGLGDHVNRYDATTLAKQGEFGSGSLTESTRLAVNSKSGRVYVSDLGAEDVAVFVPVTLPSATTHKASGLSAEGATLNGEVNPNGLELSECAFEYGETESYGETIPCAESPAQIGSGKGGVSVHADVAGLQLETGYHFRLIATNHCNAEVPGEVCEVKGQDASFATATPPLVHGESAGEITAGSAKLEGLVNPKGQPTTYQFEYLTEADWEANGKSFTGSNSPSKAPVSAAPIGSSSTDVLVTEQITGLAAETAYRYRLTAANASGSISGAEEAFTTYSAPSAFEPCPNDQFRTGAGAGLSDCRAYEQAGPIDKNGGSLQGFVFSTKAAVNGDGITFESAAGVPGGEGAQEFPLYLAKRGADQWSTQGLLPPASTGTSANVLGWTPDFSQVFDVTGGTGLGNALLALSTAGGPAREVVPYTKPLPSYSFAGASADGSKVLFDARVNGGGITPDAATGKPNLYAWDRDTGQFKLAGVLPDGSTPASGSVAGQNGNLGYTQDLHAVSSGGSTYFTAEGQLYLRENPTEPETSSHDGEGNCIPDPVLACTIQVSASHKASEPDSSLPAAFMGAATDGSKGFFTSPAELTEDAKTGPQPVIGRADIDGKNPNQSFLPVRASGVAVDGSHIYWAMPSRGTIGRVNLDGSGTVEEEFIVGAGTPQYVAVNGEYVYWTNSGNGQDGNGTIARAKLDGSGAPELNFITGASNPQGIGANGTYIFWANAGSSASTHTIGRAKIDGGEPQPGFISIGNETPQGIALNATNVFWTANNTNSGASFVVRRDVNGSNEVFAFDGADLRGIAVDGSHVYWVRQSVSRLGRANLDLSSPEPGFVIAEGKPKGLAVNGAHIYWSANGDLINPGNDLYRYDASSNSLTDIVVPDTTDINGAEVKGVLGTSGEGSYVYFVANGVPDDVTNTPNGEGESASLGTCAGTPGSLAEPPIGICNLYAWHDDGTSHGAIAFIARLDSGGGNGGDVTNWVPIDTAFPETDSQKTSRVTPDGRTVLFRSQRRLTAYDNEGVAELYRYHAGDAGPTCVSCNPTGAPPTGPARLATIKAPTAGASPPAPVLSRNLSAGGDRVFFESADALVAADTNGYGGCPPWGSALQKIHIRACQDVYEWEADGAGSCHSKAQDGGCLYLISTGKSPEASFFGDASASGDDVFTFTYSQLVAQDKDHLLDVYDARVGGGLGSQNEAEAIPCAGEACKGAPAPAPATSSPGSADAAGAGNQKPSRHRKKKRHTKKHHKKRNAKTTGRASR